MGTAIGKESSASFSCGHQHCLGPMSFHREALGGQLALRTDHRYAERNRETFRNGLAFSARPVAPEERVRLRVERCDQHWNGALRLGFTSIPPPSFPNLPYVLGGDGDGVPKRVAGAGTTRGYWACALPSSHARPGAELCFWVTSRGAMMYKGGPDGLKYRLLKGVDVNTPLWAMIDVYGQTRAVLLLRTEKKGFLKRKKQSSCPVPPPSPASEGDDSCMCVDGGEVCCSPQDYKDPTTHTGTPSHEECVVCRSATACEALPCGHRCLCSRCVSDVTTQFGSCPLCRCPITYAS